jgi:hypothetical protein
LVTPFRLSTLSIGLAGQFKWRGGSNTPAPLALGQKSTAQFSMPSNNQNLT